MAAAFQSNAFQTNAFQLVSVPAEQTITDTDILQKPVDYALAGKQLVKDRYREFDVRPPNYREKTAVRRTVVRRLEGAAPSFTVTSNRKGYD